MKMMMKMDCGEGNRGQRVLKCSCQAYLTKVDRQKRMGEKKESGMKDKPVTYRLAVLVDQVG